MTEPLLKRRPFLLGAGAGLITAAASGAALAQTRGRDTTLALPVSGTTATGTAVFGTFTPTRFLIDAAGKLAVTGVLTLTQGVLSTIIQTITLPVTNATSTCTILDLTLGPLDLNLLGLLVHLDTVHLVIEANPAGGLLGQLLCAIADILGGGLQNVVQSLLDDLVALLNQLLGLFN